MFFEGAEKRAEIVIDPTQFSLLEHYNDSFWTKVVAQCEAKILSKISNSQVRAFLLSESSLFIWANRLLILTCGDTQLINAVNYFLKHIDSTSVKQITYQRKNEYCSHLQSTHMFDDLQLLPARYQHQGKLLRFGELDTHHSYLYQLNSDSTEKPDYKTSQVLVYNIAPEISHRLVRGNVDRYQIRELLQLDKIVADFVLDDFIFEPSGYSLNAIRGNDYFTIHLTPQENSSYVTFESNMDLVSFIPTILNIFVPASFDVIANNNNEFREKVISLVPACYKAVELIEDKSGSVGLINYASFNREKDQFSPAIHLNPFKELIEF